MANQQQKRVLLAISGGVDSCVSLHLLLEQGHKVDAVYIKSWDDYEESGSCLGELNNARDARLLCQRWNGMCVRVWASV